MTYEVMVDKVTQVCFTVEANDDEEAERKALAYADNCYDFCNDPYPRYEVSDCYCIDERGCPL